MENYSQNPSPQRGRPRKLSASEWALTDTMPGKSYRHRVNSFYQARAIGCVANDPRFEWLMSDGPTIMAGKGHMRHTILAELGRIDDEAALEAMALYLCEHQPSTQEAITLIRAYRLGKRPTSSAEQLADVVRSAINTYLSAHQPLPWDQVRIALSHVLQDIDAMET